MKNKGFTLVEILVSTAIFSVIALSLYSAFHTGTVSYQKANTAFQTYQTARGILGRIELDLKNLTVYGTEAPKFIGTQNSMEFLSILEAYKGTDSNTQPCRIKYSFDKNSLGRISQSGLDALKQGLKEQPEELSGEIARFSLEYCKKVENQNPPYQWQSSWEKKDSQESGLPLAVRIKLVINEGPEFNKVVGLMLGNEGQ